MSKRRRSKIWQESRSRRVSLETTIRSKNRAFACRLWSTGEHIHIELLAFPEVWCGEGLLVETDRIAVHSLECTELLDDEIYLLGAFIDGRPPEDGGASIQIGEYYDDERGEGWWFNTYGEALQQLADKADAEIDPEDPPFLPLTVEELTRL